MSEISQNDGNPFKEEAYLAPEAEQRTTMIALLKAAQNFSHIHHPEEGILAKPHLPNNLILENIRGESFFSESRLRDYDVWPSVKDRAFPNISDELEVDRYMYQDGDELSLPTNFLIPDSYYILLVPMYYRVKNEKTGEFRVDNVSYDITILYTNEGKILKLMGENEHFFRKHHKNIYDKVGLEESPLPTPTRASDGYFELIRIPLPPQTENERIPIWIGNNAREGINWENDANKQDVTDKSLRDHYNKTARGTICYRMRHGSVDSAKQTTQKYEKFPVTHGATQPLGA